MCASANRHSNRKTYRKKKIEHQLRKGNCVLKEKDTVIQCCLYTSLKLWMNKLFHFLFLPCSGKTWWILFLKKEGWAIPHSRRSCPQTLDTGYLQESWGAPVQQNIKNTYVPSRAIQSNPFLNQSTNNDIDWQLWALLLEVLVWVSWEAEKLQFSSLTGRKSIAHPSCSFSARPTRSRHRSQADQQN